jgi:Na+-transporting NADH:ubiquinone oxidoreductase subunit A
MAKTIKLTKGFDIKLDGEALRFTKQIELSRNYALKPGDFKGIIPKLNVEVGNEVQAGQALFHSKTDEKIKFTSPVSGEVIEIKRGPKRVIEEIVILSDSKNNFKDFGTLDPKSADKDAVLNKMLDAGVWPFIRQRPFNKIADPSQTPKSIFISGFDSAPLGVDVNYLLKGNEKDFQTGIDAIKHLTSGKIHLNLSKRLNNGHALSDAHGVEKTYFDGPHPAGNVGIQMHHLDPVITKNDLVWFVSPQDLIIIGRLFNTGKYDARKLVAVAGTSVTARQYYEASIGVNVSALLENKMVAGSNRVISGNVLTGQAIGTDGYLGFYDSLLTVIPEGHDEEFLGWLLPTYPRPSISRTFPSFMFPEKKYTVNTNMHGEDRAYVVTGEYEKVLPMDVLPLQLIKACLAKDIENMEALGIYEVSEEDFALCEFICTSKSPIQEIIGSGLEFIEKEA